jgi:integrase
LKEKRCAPNTYADYADCVERDLIPAFGRRRLLDLRPKQIDDWVTAQHLRPSVTRPPLRGCGSS